MPKHSVNTAGNVNEQKYNVALGDKGKAPIYGPRCSEISPSGKLDKLGRILSTVSSLKQTYRNTKDDDGCELHDFVSKWSTRGVSLFAGSQRLLR